MSRANGLWSWGFQQDRKVSRQVCAIANGSQCTCTDCIYRLVYRCTRVSEGVVQRSHRPAEQPLLQADVARKSLNWAGNLISMMVELCPGGHQISVRIHVSHTRVGQWVCRAGQRHVWVGVYNTCALGLTALCTPAPYALGVCNASPCKLRLLS